MNLSKNEAKGLKVTTFAIAQLESNNYMGSNQEKYNIAIAILKNG